MQFLEVASLSPRLGFNISFGPSSWFAYSSCGHGPVPKCKAPSGMLGSLSCKFLFGATLVCLAVWCVFLIVLQWSTILGILFLFFPGSGPVLGELRHLSYWGVFSF